MSFFALFASVALVAPEKEVLTCVSFVVQLTVWEISVGEFLPAYIAWVFGVTPGAQSRIGHHPFRIGVEGPASATSSTFIAPSMVLF